VTATTEDVSITREIEGVGLLEFTETEKSRAYWLTHEGGKRRVRLPSVTGILESTWPSSHQLNDFFKREGLNADKIRDAAGTRGKAIHKFIERYLADGDLLPFKEFPEEYLPYFEATAQFLWDHDLEAVAVERLICHPEHRYAGRLDLIARTRATCNTPTCPCHELQGLEVLWDFKTSASGRVYPKAFVQAEGYRMADERCGGAPIDAVAIVGIGENGEYRIVQGVEEAKPTWMLVLEFYRQLQKLDKALA